MSRRSPAALCSGISTGIAAIVVQFGLAMMPLRASAIDSGLTSDTTSGTSGSIRHADELSMTMAPAAANFGASSLDDVAPAENSAMSRPDRSAVAASSTVMSVSPHGSVVPAERADAKYRISSTGNDRSARSRRMTAADLTCCAHNSDSHGRQCYGSPPTIAWQVCWLPNRRDEPPVGGPTALR